MDEIRFGLERIDTPAYGPIEAVSIFINGRDLLERAREVELPFAVRDGHPDLAGGYIGLPVGSVFWPSRRLMGKPDERYDSGVGRISVLGCVCGDVGCWPLQARITVREDVVVWHDFMQPHRRRWDYSEMGPFTFDRGAYEAELRGAPASRM